MQLYLSVFQEVQGDLDVLQLVEAHASFLPWLRRRTQHTSEGVHTVNMRYKYILQSRGARLDDCGRESQASLSREERFVSEILPVMAAQWSNNSS